MAESYNGRTLPVGTQRYWESSNTTMVKTHDNTPFDDYHPAWIPLPKVSGDWYEIFAYLDKLGRRIREFEEPVNGYLWLKKEFEDFRTTSGKSFIVADFIKYTQQNGKNPPFSFSEELARRLVLDKINLNSYIADELMGKNDNKKFSLANEGHDINSKIHLSKEEIKEIREKAKLEFKFDENERLTKQDVTEIQSVLTRVVGYLEKGVDFEGEQGDIYKKCTGISNEIEEGPYVNVYQTRERMKQALVDMNKYFSDAWGVRESFRVRIYNAFAKFVRRYREEIENDALETFKKKTGVDLYCDSETFYTALRNTYGTGKSLSRDELKKYVGQEISNPFEDDYSTITILGIGGFDSDDSVKVYYTKTGESESEKEQHSRWGRVISLSRLSKAILDGDAIGEIEIPLKLRSTKILNKDLEGNFGLDDVGLVEALEKLSSFLPQGHLLTNDYLKKIRRDSLMGSDNGYAHYDPTHKEVFFSEEAMLSAQRGFSQEDLTSGQSELASVLIHEIGHSVSQKLGRRRSKWYKQFVYQCGWSWQQFPRGLNVSYQNTGSDPDIKRFGTNADRPLITEYAHKSPEESFAEYYSFYSQHKKDIDKYLETNGGKTISKHKELKVEKVENPHTFGEYTFPDEHNNTLVNEMQNVLAVKKRSLTDHIRIGVIDPYYEKNLETMTQDAVKTGHIISQKMPQSTNRKEPLPVFTVFDYNTGKHDIIHSDEGIDSHIHYANKYLRRLSPTFSLSKECYNILQEKGYTYSQIREFCLKQIENHHIPKVKEVVPGKYGEIQGLRYRGHLVPKDDILKMRTILISMKNIWESDELQKALEELFNTEEDSLEKALTHEYITVHPKDGKPYQRLQRKKIQEAEPIDGYQKNESKAWDRDKQMLWDLKGKLFEMGVKHEGVYYNKFTGNIIPIPEKFREEIEKEIHGKSLNKLSLKHATINGKQIDEKTIREAERKNLDKLLKVVERRKEITQQLIEREEKKYNKIYNPQSNRERVQRSLGSITTKSTQRDLHKILEHLNDLGGLESDIDPILVITHKGKEYEKLMSEVMNTFEKHKEEGNYSNKEAGIESVKIKDFDKYTDEDFNVKAYNPHSYENSKQLGQWVQRRVEQEGLLKSETEDIEILDQTHTEEDKTSFFGSILNSLKNLLGLTDKPKHQKYSDVLVRNTKGELLLLQRNSSSKIMPDKWGLPGGHVDDGEDFITAAVRELEEETGLKFNSSHLTYLETKKKEECTIAYFYILLDFPHPMILNNDEHYRSQWVKSDKLDEYPMMFDLYDVIQELDLPLVPLHQLSFETENFLDTLHNQYRPKIEQEFESGGKDFDIVSYYNNLDLLTKMEKGWARYQIEKGFEKGLVSEIQYFNFLKQNK